MAEAITKIVITDEGLYHGRGDVYKWLLLLTTHFEQHAVHYAPMRHGALKAGITHETHQVGPRQVLGIIASYAPHTLYVLRGTTGPIMTNKRFANPEGGIVHLYGRINEKGKFSRKGEGTTFRTRRKVRPVRVRGYWMPIPAHEGYRKFFASEVSGQAANNFLEKAWRETARNHTSIRGPVPSFILNP